MPLTWNLTADRWLNVAAAILGSLGAIILFKWSFAFESLPFYGQGGDDFQGAWFAQSPTAGDAACRPRANSSEFCRARDRAIRQLLTDGHR